MPTLKEILPKRTLADMLVETQTVSEPNTFEFLNDPNDIEVRAKDVLKKADRFEVPISSIERSYEQFSGMEKRQKTTVGMGAIWDIGDDKRTMREILGYGKPKKTVTINIGRTLWEVPKGLVRFFERGIGGTSATVLGDWLGQFIYEGGVALDWFGKLGTKNKDQVYNPIAQSIMTFGTNLSAEGKKGRERWAYAAATGWEALDEDLKKKDPISYGAGRLSEGVASSALSVLTMYVSGPVAVAGIVNKSIQINRGLVALSLISAAGGFEHAQRQGENFYWSTIHGLADGVVEYAMESTFLKGIGKGTGKLVAGAKEGAEEFFTGMFQNTRAGILENQNKGMSAYESAKVAMISSLKQSPWEVAAGFIGGFGIAGGANLVQLYKQSKPTPAEKLAKGLERKVGVSREIAEQAVEMIAEGRPVAEVDKMLTQAKISERAVLPEAELPPELIEEPAEPPSKIVEKPLEPPPKPITSERRAVEPKLKPRDILGGIDPIQQIHKALKEAKAVQPLTKAQKATEMKRRVGAAAGALKSNVKKGVPAEEAIFKSTGLLKGPLTEYDQLYTSIEDILEPGAKEAAYTKIYSYPSLQYFEILNTATSFKKLLAGTALTPTDVKNIENIFGKTFVDITETRLVKNDLYDRIITIWKAGLLTGIKTTGLNTLANVSHAVSETAKDIPASLVDRAVALFTGDRALAFTAKGTPSGIRDGIKRGWKYLRTGYDERNIGAKLDYKTIHFGNGKIAKSLQVYEETIFHLLGAEDQPFYYGAKSRSLFSQAIAQAKNKGLKGKERDVFVENLVKNPTNDMLIASVHDAEVAVFQNRTTFGDIAKAIQKVKGGEVVVPFGRTPSAVAMQIINYSPVGIAKEIAEQIHAGEFNQRKFSQAFGRTVVGTGALYIGSLLFKAGLITLDHPRTEKERELWKLEGRKANSIKIGDKWRSIQVLGPIGNGLIIGGHFQRELEKEGSPTKAIVTAMSGGVKSFSEQTFVRGVNLAVDALASPERSFENWFSSMAGSAVPTIVADIARAEDEVGRRAVGPLERIQARIPIVRKGLEPSIDVFGQDLPRYGGNVLETMIDPSRPAKIRRDVVVDELRRLFDVDIKISPTLLGDRKGYDILTAEENTRLWRRAGELTYKALLGIISTKEYQDIDNDFAKGKLLEPIVAMAKESAKMEIVGIKLNQGVSIIKLAESGLLSIEGLDVLKYFGESNETEE